MAGLPDSQGNFPEPEIITTFKEKVEVLFDHFWTTVLLYQIDIQVYNHSRLEEGIVDMTLVYANANGEEMTWEVRGLSTHATRK